ncbi:SPRY domain-containing SOCS box protein 3 [Menidia menidia]
MSHCKTVYRKTTARVAMLRRSRSGRARHLAYIETRQEADVMASVQTSDKEEQERQTATQISSLESEVDYLTDSHAAAVALSTIAPVMGESFCQCEQQEELSPGFRATSDCLCGEEEQVFDWAWDEQCKSSGSFLSCDNRKVTFHSDYSCGTAAIRGNKELSEGQHYWEVKMTSPVYGTDMMVGIGTSEVNLDKFKYSFGSLLGNDEDSWGLSYTGLLQHKGDKVKFSSRFGEGSIIGVHLDTWHGTLTFYKNRQRIGVAATRLQNKKLYPMVCSTAAKSSMKVIRACYAPTSLTYLCCAQLRRMLPSCCPDVVEALDLPPGLRPLLQTRLGWVFSLSNSSGVSPEEQEQEQEQDPSPDAAPDQMSLSSSPSPPPTPIPCPETAPYLRPCHAPAQTHSTACHCPPTPPSSDNDSCCSEPEDYQCKRCRWT